MRIVVFPNSLGLGGSQINAIDLGAEMVRRGHRVTVFAPPGPLRERVLAQGMDHVAAPARPRVRPSPSVVRELRAVVRATGADLVHAYEWPPILEAFYGCRVPSGLPVVGTVMSMGVAPFIPAPVPLVVGTEQIAETERRRRDIVHVIEPPVDLLANDPAETSPPDREQALGTDPEVLVVVVSRLAHQLKLEGLLGAIRAMGRLAEEASVHLAVVGDGPARVQVEQEAARVNGAAGRPVVTMVGEVADPRPWYAAADVALGMGSSALRAMAFEKPLVVQGELGFWRLLTPQTLSGFLHTGWYGIGSGGDGSPALEGLLRELVASPETRRELGRFARTVVEERFSLTRAADLQEEIYTAVLDDPWHARQLGTLGRPVARLVDYEVRRRYARVRGRAAEDDFNAIQAQARSTTGRMSP